MAGPVLTQDMYVYSTFSDGRNTIEENVAEAEQIGLAELTFVGEGRAPKVSDGTYPAAISATRCPAAAEHR